MTIFELFIQLAQEQPQLFGEAYSMWGPVPKLPSVNMLGNIETEDTSMDDQLVLFGPQLRQVKELLKQTVEFKNVDNIYFVDAPVFLVESDSTGVPIKDSTTYLGDDVTAKQLAVDSYSEEEGLPQEFSGDVYIYLIRVDGVEKPINIKTMKPGVVMQRDVFSEDRVLVIKYNPQKVMEITGLKGTELMERLSANIGTNIAKVIADDKSTVEKSKVCSIRLKHMPKEYGKTTTN